MIRESRRTIIEHATEFTFEERNQRGERITRDA
jgi:hypothetical protein